MKSSSIGSPFLSYIKLKNNSQSIAEESSSIMIPLGVEVLLVTVARINNSNQSRIDDPHLNRVG